MGYLERLDTYRDDMIRTLGESVARPSVTAPPVRTTDGELLPFGKDVHEALLHMLDTGKALGFEAVNADNYVGYIECKADGDDADKAETVAVVGHLDVVPAGNGWNTDPFVMTEKDGVLYGRGTADDKGPVVASLYAMKALREEGLPIKKNIRLVMGLDEETGDESMKYYTDNYGHPAMGFTPDGDFPLVNGEMGIVVFELARKFTQVQNKEDLRLTRLEAGTASNMVAGTAKAVIAGDKKYYDSIRDRAAAYALETGYTLRSKKQGSSLIIEAVGIPAHGAKPELGLNAISIMMDFLGRVGFASEELNDFIAFYNDHIGFDLHGERLGINFEDNESGPLILNVGIANINEEFASLTVNIRFPVSYTDSDVMSGIEECTRDTRIGIVIRKAEKPLYMDVDSPLASTLLTAYRDETGDDTPPMVIAGGTYAKAVDNILCFGGEFPGVETSMHQADEKLSIDSLMRMARIYARALYALCCE